MKVEVAGIHVEAVRELAVRQLLAVASSEGLQDSEAKRMPERFQLLRALDLEELAHGSL